MGELKDKAKGIGNELAGNAKQASDDPETRAEGRAQERKGEAQNLKGEIKGALGAAFGAWARRVETTAEFEAALTEAMQRKGLRLLHCVTEVEQLSAAGATVSSLRSKG